MSRPADTEAGSWIGPGTRAIITGASWGIGESFAEALAARGAALLLVARTETRLLTIAADLQARYGVRVEIVTLDLAEPDGPRRVFEAASGLGFEPTLLINNAGLGILGPFAELPLDKAREIVRLNVAALTEITYRFLQGMLARGDGAIINVASASAFQPVPNYGLYAASKAYVVSFGAALWAECRHSGVRVVTVCPGPVDAGAPSEQQAYSRLERLRRSFPRKVRREDVVTIALDAVERNEPIVIPGAPAARLALRLLPRRTRLRLTHAVLRRFPRMMTGTRRREP
jgi:short-subunit dehydrogenase